MMAIMPMTMPAIAPLLRLCVELCGGILVPIVAVGFPVELVDVYEVGIEVVKVPDDADAELEVLDDVEVVDGAVDAIVVAAA